MTWIDGLVGDLRLGLRTLSRQPGFSLAAICTFALGIGAATAIFSVAYGIAFRPLPYPAADRLVRIYESNRATAEPKLLVSEGVFQSWRVRIALGARTARLVQLWLSEVLILAVGGASLGITVAWWLVQLLRTAAPPGLPRLDDIAVDPTALSVAGVATILSAVICAFVPALGTRDHSSLKGLVSGTARSGDAPGRRRLSTGLVAIQCGTALVLVVLTFVFARRFMKLTAVDLGWQPAHVLSLNLTLLRPSRPSGQSFYTQWAQRLIARLETTPGITRAAVTSGIPFSPANVAASIGRGPTGVADETRWPITLHSVTEGYFQTLGLTLRQGRLFTSDDQFDEPTLARRATPTRYAAIVSESVADALWPAQDPLGEQFHIPSFGFGSC